jgi:hypothetical protein
MTDEELAARLAANPAPPIDRTQTPRLLDEWRWLVIAAVRDTEEHGYTELVDEDVVHALVELAGADPLLIASYATIASTAGTDLHTVAESIDALVDAGALARASAPDAYLFLSQEVASDNPQNLPVIDAAEIERRVLNVERE